MIKKLFKKNFFRNILLVVSGSAGAQAIAMAFTPFITRLYGPEAFGELGAFVALLGIFTPLVALAYPIAIVLPKSDSAAIGIAKLSLLIAIFTSTFLAFLILVWDERLIELLNLQLTSSFLIFIPIALLGTGSLQVIQQWLIRKKQFKTTAKVAISQSLIMNISKASAGLLLPLSSVLIIFSTVSSFLHAGLLLLGWYKCSEKNVRTNRVPISNVSLTELAYCHRDFPLYRAPQQFINGLAQSIPVLMLASFFGPAAAGFYTLSRTVAGVPATLISNAVGDVFYPRITAAANNKEKLFPLLFKATSSLAVVGLLPFGSLIIFGPWLFYFVFGPEWVVAGEYVRYLAPWLYFIFINAPSNKIIPVLSIQGYYLCFTCCTIIIRVLALAIGYYVFKTELASILFFSIAGVLLNAILIGAVLIITRNYDNRNSFNE
ncbi:lipopolysaccharide biosynthesis protein [Vibrio sp. Y42_MX_L11]|uniref:lipopolysaccharide biosynthesis protein n=1 Tax=Vibrio sp. Y42_MX_L11 TaxID=2957765 RepID=UPI0020A2E442|nr:oligosaccharide flippase family protein [Vibrio sp. Y42_MX_L11]